MKVLLQRWKDLETDKRLTSISKGQAQLEVTIKELSSDDAENPATAVESAQWVEIPNDHGLSELVEYGTVFLEPDEMNAITYLNE